MSVALLRKSVVRTPTNRLCLGLKSVTVMMRAARGSTTATINKKRFPVLVRIDEVRSSRSTTALHAAGSRNTNCITRGHRVDQSNTGTQARL